MLIHIPWIQSIMLNRVTGFLWITEPIPVSRKKLISIFIFYNEKKIEWPPSLDTIFIYNPFPSLHPPFIHRLSVLYKIMQKSKGTFSCCLALSDPEIWLHYAHFVLICFLYNNMTKMEDPILKVYWGNITKFMARGVSYGNGKLWKTKVFS